MAEFVFDLDGLTPVQRDQVVKHLEQTYHLAFGHLEQITANFFRVAPVPDSSAPAVALRELVTSVRAAGPARVKLAGLDRFQRVRMSQLLEQTAGRPYRDGDAEVGRVLDRLRAGFDRQAKVAADEAERAELAAFPAAMRDSEAIKREQARLAKVRVT